MSNRRHAKLLPPASVAAPHWHQSRDVDNLCDGECVVTQTAVVSDHRDEALIVEGHRATHDSLVNGLGDRRRSGIWWTHHEGEEALAAVDQIHAADDPNPHVLEVRAGTLEHLNASEHSVFIIAWCIAEGAEGEVLYG